MPPDLKARDASFILCSKFARSYLADIPEISWPTIILAALRLMKLTWRTPICGLFVHIGAAAFGRPQTSFPFHWQTILTLRFFSV